MTGYHWLASYPRSGNTWLRLALNSLRNGGAAPALEQRNDFAPVAAGRQLFDSVVGVDSSDLTRAEIEELRPRVYEAEAAASGVPIIRKVHDAWTRTRAGEPLFPVGVTLGSIYIVRDPRDVAVSYAAFAALSIDQAIDFMASDEAHFGNGVGSAGVQLPQRLLSWSGHVESWLDGPPQRPLLVRYEDMLSDPYRALRRAAELLGWEVAEEALAGAVSGTRFSALQAQEAGRGFREKLPSAPTFFRRGLAEGWRDTLSARQVARIEHAHGRVMARLGYR